MLIALRKDLPAVHRERFQLDFFIDGSAWQGLFDRVEVWRSRISAQGPYEPLMADSMLPAILPPGNEAVLAPNPPIDGPGSATTGLLLQFLLNERVPVNVTFTGVNPVTFGEAATQIETQSLGTLLAFAYEDILVVQTVQAGLAATLRCVGGDAAPLLGLVAQCPLSLAYGRDPRIELVFGQENYSFVDPYGSSDFFYKARFFNTLTRTASEFSPPFQGRPLIGVPAAGLCRCYVNLVDLTGAPLANQEVLISSTFNGTEASGRVVAGGQRRLLTDQTGHAEVLLVRGTPVTVGIGGTTIARDVVVPADTTVESIDLLSSANGQNDVFTVQIPTIPYAVRRTL
jgi:hypothetical protein